MRLRAIGGTLFLTGGVIAVYNLYRTARQGALIPEEEMQAPPMQAPRGRIASRGTERSSRGQCSSRS